MASQHLISERLELAMRVTVTANNQPVEKTAAVTECYGIAFKL